MSTVKMRDRKWAARLKPEYVECRVLGHAWEDVTGMPGGKVRRVEYLTGRRMRFRCTRCTMERHETWSELTGELIARQYDQPGGYKLGRVELPSDVTMRQAMRVERMSRIRRDASGN